MNIYAVFERDTGRYAGSGTPYFDTTEHGSTEVLPDHHDGQIAIWTGDAWVYEDDPDASPPWA